MGREWNIFHLVDRITGVSTVTRHWNIIKCDGAAL